MPYPRKPSTLHRLEGTKPKYRQTGPEPQPTGRPRIPNGAVLTAAQQVIWKALVASLPPTLLTRADEAVLELMSIFWAQFREVNAAIAEGGLMVEGRDGNMVKNPLVAIQRAAAQQMNACGAALGLSPAARTRLTVPVQESTDPLEILLGPEGKSWSEQAH